MQGKLVWERFAQRPKLVGKLPTPRDQRRLGAAAAHSAAWFCLPAPALRPLLRGFGGDLAEALADYEEVARLNPPGAMYRTNIGNTQYKLNDYAAAVAAYDQAIGHDPRMRRHSAGRTAAHQALGNIDAARADYTQAIALFQAQGQDAEARRAQERLDALP
jgi:tetratricopeptide (TPR) repeat protein